MPECFAVSYMEEKSAGPQKSVERCISGSSNSDLFRFNRKKKTAASAGAAVVSADDQREKEVQSLPKT